VRPLLVALLVVLVSELGVRALDLPTPLVFSSVEAQIKADELRATGPGRIHTVFVGSSVLDVAVQPDRFATAAGLDGDAYNAALLGADMRSLELWVEHVVVPAVAPERVVFGLNCRELNGAEDAQDTYFAEFSRAPEMARVLGRETVLDRVDRTVSRWSDVVRYRTVLRDPRNLFQPDRRVGVNLDLVGGGFNAAYANRTYPPPERLHEVLFPGAMTRFETGPDLVASLERTLRHLREEGIEAAVVAMPVTEDFVGYLPTPEDFAGCADTMAAIAASTGAQFYDGGILERELFADPIHVNGAGSAHVTDLLADALGRGAAG
jgi:hypothetical protein